MDFQIIDRQINLILNGTRDLSGFNQQEHAGICTAGSSLIGALIVCNHTRESLAAGSHATAGQESVPNWQIDQAQEAAVYQWAESRGIWIPHADEWLESSFGPMIAQGAEAKVFYHTGDTSVVKERASIYATLGRALEAIVLHNTLFPETLMRVIGYTRDADGIFRIILTQPYIECERLASKSETDALLQAKGFLDNGDGSGVNYFSDRLLLEDMHPANIFIDRLTSAPICIDCIVKFRK